MALRSGIDTVAIVTKGMYSETYISATGDENIASLIASWGFIEEAPEIGLSPARVMSGDWFWEFIG